MSLKEYARKRDFEKTPEPKPSTPAAQKTKRSFYVQRHDATRLHYDLRLEIGGTLKSWAVPKGPSLDPARKNLAMMVEDHPLEYGTFEGNIPAGNYGAGSVMLWDQGSLEILEEKSPEAQLERGDLKFRLDGEKLKGSFALVRMKNRGKGNEWLLIKKRDGEDVAGWDVEAHAWSVKTGRTQDEIAKDLPPKKTSPQTEKSRAKQSPASKSAGPDPSALPGAVKSPIPQNVGPMMAFLSAKVPSGSNWVYEIKWDGVRAMCYLEDGKLRMVSRNGNSFDRQYPELSVVPHYVAAGTAIIDGEIAVVDEKGRSSFGLIQPRIHQTDPNSIAHLVRSTPVKLFAFDLLYMDGYDLRQAPLVERKRLLREIIQPMERLQYSDHFEARGEEMLEAARAMGLEGLVAKDASSKYESRRSRSWLKIKVVGNQEFVICGFTHGERDTFSSLVLGLYENKKLVYVGNVGTGFNDRSLRMLHERLQPLIQPAAPFAKKPAMLREVTWVRPELVCEVKFSEWTRDGKLRAPVFLGLRDDKRPEECVREVPVSETAEDTGNPVESSQGPLLPPGVKQQSVKIGSATLKFTNLDKVLYPRDGFTKRDVLNYYDSVADLLVPHLKDRPLSLKRYPNGIDEEFFFQKDMPDHMPSWIRVEPIHSEHRGAAIRYAIANDRATLLYLVNLGCLDQNPWMSRIGSLDRPDYILIDLDPLECSYDKIVRAALLVRQKLDDLALKGYPKTTGGDGMHVYIPIEPNYTYEQARSFAEVLSQLVINEEPDLFTTPRAVAKRRKGRVYFDYLQISTGKTIAAPYVLRAYDGAPVSTPLSWDEVRPGLSPQQFTLKNALERFRRTGDLFEPVLTKPQKLEPVIKRLSKLMAKPAS
jgi:bifunctional non-homologous end joining protein LigD